MTMRRWVLKFSKLIFLQSRSFSKQCPFSTKTLNPTHGIGSLLKPYEKFYWFLIWDYLAAKEKHMLVLLRHLCNSLCQKAANERWVWKPPPNALADGDICQLGHWSHNENTKRVVSRHQWIILRKRYGGRAACYYQPFINRALTGVL